MTAALVVTILVAVGYVAVNIARLTSACLAVFSSGDIQPSADDGGQLTREREH